ncbi:dihydrodipicolinate reductase C-terminal domain-containing protein [Porphyromonas endodontalis]|uniref:4-hydroxy-tetrahydrodipicolinate reductase n=1 Tax=Porphyromonas endodontalis TaxID=28124 RepID=UPI00288ACC8C|nr:dihydrodipicolinate reductase C-terminal domain-containing protein [Porphyromonas endodontalis]
MDILLVGYGRMGKAIEKEAIRRGHHITGIFDADGECFTEQQQLPPADVCIEFTTPQTAYKNCLHAINKGLPVVSGTTGWRDDVQKLQDDISISKSGTFFYASNFSLGVNILFELNRQLARIMQKAPEYSVSLEETHHVHKLDAPSGTAITLAEDIIKESPNLDGWALAPNLDPHTLPIEAKRIGEIPGIHSIKWHSPVDELTLSHEAFRREGFALGALLAAEYAVAHHGVLSMRMMLGFSD